MDFSGIIQNVKDKFSQLSIIDKIKEFYKENKKLFFIIVAMFLLILICIILLVSTAQKNKTSKKNAQSVLEQPFVLTQELQVPQGPEMPESYTISRKTTSVWTEEEAKTWFTIPSEKEINALSKSNENMIKELLEAAP